MAIYPTKTNKLNMKNKRNRLGVSLIVTFSIILIMLVFNFIEIFNITILGTFGLIVYPISLFMIVLGIMTLCDKSIKTTKTILILSLVWLAVFTLILQTATSKNIDSGFATYIETTFKSCSTAGGVVFGTILYPLYIITHSLATYIILSVILVVLTGILIDKIYLEVKNYNFMKSQSQDMHISNNDVDYEEDEEEEELAYSNEYMEEETEDDDIFIKDDIESEQKEEAKSRLGLSKNVYAEDNETQKSSYIEQLEKDYKEEIEEEQESNFKKPNIYVHEDNFDTNNNFSYVKPEKPKTPSKEELDEEKRQAALAYLNISKGKFETKNQKKGLDNVAPNKPENVWQEEQKTQQPQNNLNKLTSLKDRFNAIENMHKQASGPSDFVKNDIYDENLTKKSFESNQDKFATDNNRFNSISSKIPEMARKVYSGEANDNIVESTSFRPVQESMLEPTKPRPQQKAYKKPPTYVKPPLDLLTRYTSSIDDDSTYIQEKGNKIVETLKSFKIETRIINAIKGPTFTRYELQMAPGISVNTIKSKIDDLSMVLESACRVQVPIPGKNAFGIEVPNKKRVIVGLRDIIESANFQNSKSPLTFALGKDISADCKVAQIDKMVHTLVAGTTGSGKSICLNTMLLSLLYKASPEDLRIVLVDPKQVEFTLFNNLPHMLIPNTITDCEKAVSALGWLVEEMDRRYKKLSNLGVKNIGEYNETSEVMSGTIPKMFYIVMIFDEVGDFMVRAKKEIEEKVLLLAAKSRACGIHLILATQRPTVDVITGTIKANLPSRIAFAVSSPIDSKTILETTGAEMLLGKGDMLYLPQGKNDAERIQGCLVETKDLKAVINFVNEHNEAQFDEEIEDQMFNKKDSFESNANGVEDAFDPMLKDCLRYFIKAKKASASSLQGYFGIGYPKANKIVLQMERAGFISAGDHNGRRTLFITEQEFEERFGEDLDQ